MIQTPEHRRTPIADHLSPAAELIPALLRFARVLRRRRHIVLNSLLACSFIGLAYYTLAPRLYQSTARLHIIQQKQDQIATVGESDASDSTMATHRELATSPVVLQRAIARLAPEHRIDLVERLPQDWHKAIASQLSAAVTRRTNILDVTYRSRHPEAAAAVVRAIIESYLEFVQENYKGTAGEMNAVLTENQEDVDKLLAQKQAELQAVREAIGHLALPTDEGLVEPIVQRALKVNESLMAAQQRTLELRSTLVSIDAAISRGEDVTQYLGGVQESVGEQMLLMNLGMSEQDMAVLAEQEKKLLAAQDDLQKLSPFFGPNHPQITELQQQVVNLDAYLHSYRANLGNRMNPSENTQLATQVKALLEQAITQCEERERQLARSFEQARKQAAQHSGRIVDLQMKEDEVAFFKKKRELLLDKIANLDVRQVQAPIHVTVVREPVAEASPVSPQLRLVALACLFIGSAVGCAIVYVLDVMDDRFDSPEELQAQLGVPVLTIVREMQSLHAEGLDSVQAFVAPDSADTEAFRTLRTAITLNPTGTDRILISSSEPGDGKTTVAINLAVAFAQAGKRTLLIDADMRKPGLTTLLALKSHAGLAELLVADQAVGESVAESLCKTSQASLHVIPTGRRRPNPAELLSNGRFAELLVWAESHYDQVLVDCPPVLAVSDAQIVGQLVDGALLVVRPDKNHRRNVVRAVENFQAASCHVLGVVANGVAHDADAYGYGYGYGYGYEESAANLAEIARPRTSLADLAELTKPEVGRFDPVESMPAKLAAASSHAELIRPRRAA